MRKILISVSALHSRRIRLKRMLETAPVHSSQYPARPLAPHFLPLLFLSRIASDFRGKQINLRHRPQAGIGVAHLCVIPFQPDCTSVVLTPVSNRMLAAGTTFPFIFAVPPTPPPDCHSCCTLNLISSGSHQIMEHGEFMIQIYRVDFSTPFAPQACALRLRELERSIYSKSQRLGMRGQICSQTTGTCTQYAGSSARRSADRRATEQGRIVRMERGLPPARRSTCWQPPLEMIVQLQLGGRA